MRPPTGPHPPVREAGSLRQIGWEAGSRRIEEQDLWAKDVFPAAHQCLKQAAATIAPGGAPRPGTGSAARAHPEVLLSCAVTFFGLVRFGFGSGLGLGNRRLFLIVLSPRAWWLRSNGHADLRD